MENRVIESTNEVTLCELSDAYGLNLSTEVSERADWDYNCMGFALGTYDWNGLCNFQYSYEFDYDNEEHSNYMEFRDEVCWECAAELENLHYTDPYFPKMRMVENEKNLHDNEYLIAMRVSEDDFHFMRRMSDGRWFEKCGAGILRECTDAVWEDEWISPNEEIFYNSVIILFAVEQEVA